MEACIHKGCTSHAHSRGLCNQHYLAAYRAVKAGETSWRELERMNMAKPPGKVGRPSKFRQLIEDARARLRKSRRKPSPNK